MSSFYEFLVRSNTSSTNISLLIYIRRKVIVDQTSDQLNVYSTNCCISKYPIRQNVIRPINGAKESTISFFFNCRHRSRLSDKQSCRRQTRVEKVIVNSKLYSTPALHYMVLSGSQMPVMFASFFPPPIRASSLAGL